MKITLKAARVNAGLKQSDVARAISVSRQTISKWECGKSTPNVKQFKHLAALYKMSCDDMFLTRGDDIFLP
ncbi:MAG TPA: helix-turn-helix transcriptional regulator [Candidatus Eubacterium faecipullorum]|uniref:Helix-turn-helix transcriptional regulator n=1 Tax=Candidatus Eubacterium faecipullorum TaxID=2838571 RepID=A0A9D1UFL7_9FIRM|nr:helix-turn-helix transcriptional regulator [Candidatus Eubacterium faecipullorum]